MGVLMQAFYRDCFNELQGSLTWWQLIRQRIPDLSKTGFTSLWLPPVHKAANIGCRSMGYDPYDYYDLGEYDQRGGVPTQYGTKAELLDLIASVHDSKMTVLADLVINHCSGADSEEDNPITKKKVWSLFKPASGKFYRNWECFNPGPYAPYDPVAFDTMPDLSHRNPYVYAELLKLTKWMIEEIGFDGFRYDFVKGYGAETIAAIQEYYYLRDGKPFKPYGVAEHWSSASAIEEWVERTNFSKYNPVDAFDFPLRDMLRNICDGFGFSLRNIADWDTVLKHQPNTAVTFVDNHDLGDMGSPIVNAKLLAYSYILTHEGYPCVFWKDYFNYNLALDESPNGIAMLVRLHEDFAAGTTQILWLDDDLYMMQRSGNGNKPGLIYVLNNRGDNWNGRTVITNRPGMKYIPLAWWSQDDLCRPDCQSTDSGGKGQFWAPPRGYCVYIPEA